MLTLFTSKFFDTFRFQKTLFSKLIFDSFAYLQNTILSNFLTTWQTILLLKHEAYPGLISFRLNFQNWSHISISLVLWLQKAHWLQSRRQRCLCSARSFFALTTFVCVSSLWLPSTVKHFYPPVYLFFQTLDPNNYKSFFQVVINFLIKCRNNSLVLLLLLLSYLYVPYSRE